MRIKGGVGVGVVVKGMDEDEDWWIRGKG